MSSLFEKDLDQLVARGDLPLVPTRPATPSVASLFIEGYSPWCSSIQPNNTYGGVTECPSTLHMLCTQCNASGDDIRLVVDRESGATLFVCNSKTCFGLMFARWSPHNLTVRTWSGVYLESKPNPRVHGPVNRLLQLKVLDLNDGYFLQHLQHNSEYISFADLPDMFVNNRLAFGGPKAIELRRRVRKTEYRWLAFTPSAGEFYIGKEKKLLLRIVNSTVPIPFRFTATDDFESLVVHAKEVPTDTEDESPVPSRPARKIPAARKKPDVIPRSIPAVAGPSAAPGLKKPVVAPPSGASVRAPSATPSSKPTSGKKCEVIDLTLSDNDEPSPAPVPKQIRPIRVIVDGDDEAILVSAGQKRKRIDSVIGKEKKIRTGGGKENVAGH